MKLTDLAAKVLKVLEDFLTELPQQAVKARTAATAKNCSPDNDPGCLTLRALESQAEAFRGVLRAHLAIIGTGDVCGDTGGEGDGGTGATDETFVAGHSHKK